MDDIIHEAMRVFFGVLQALIMVTISCAFKMYWDVKKLKRDLRAAFTKIRELEKRDQRNQETVEPSAHCSGASPPK